MARFYAVHTELLRLAVTHRWPLLIKYKDSQTTRLILPHRFGTLNKNGKHTICAYQVAGNSKSTGGKIAEGWRLFEQRRITSVAVLDSQSFTPRGEHSKTDQRFERIIAEV